MLLFEGISARSGPVRDAVRDPEVKVHGAAGVGALCIEEHGKERGRRDGSKAAETDGIAGSIWIVPVLEGGNASGGHRDGLLSSAGTA
jgi:hypothetical protein